MGGLCFGLMLTLAAFGSSSETEPSVDRTGPVRSVHLKTSGSISGEFPPADASKAKNQLKKIDSERKLLEAMGSTLLKGDDYPDIEENIAYMHLMHENMLKAGKYACVSGKPRSAGAADCISLKHCTVWEFGPSTASRSVLLKAASDAINDVNNVYEDDAQHCYAIGSQQKR